MLTGALVALTAGGWPGYLVAALELDPAYRLIGIGMWLALIMAANVWVVIWPNQKKALGIVPADDAVKAKAASVAMMASRTNTLLSLADALLHGELQRRLRFWRRLVCRLGRLPAAGRVS